MNIGITKSLGAACALLAVTACTKPLEVTTAPKRAAYVAGFDQGRVARSNTITVRTYTGRKRDREEFAGARCQMKSAEIKANFVTPAKIIVPAFVQKRAYANRGRPTQLRIVCKANGKTGVESFSAANKKVSTSTNAGITGAILTTIVSGAIASSTPWKYPDVLPVQVDGVK